MFEMIFNIALVVLGFSFIIAIHELGHFLAAKRAGIECPVYSIGFPLPAITKIPERFRNIISIHWRGTDYRIGWIPFGGFVQMKGQSDTPDEMDENEGSEDDFRNVSYGNKVLVITGGVIMNAITGIVFFILAFAVFGVTFIAPVVGSVVPADAKDPSVITTLWEQGKVNPGDRITAVNGKPVEDYEDAAYAAFFDEDGVIEMTFTAQDGVETTIDVDLYNIHSKLDAKLPPVMMSAELLVGDNEAEASGGKLKGSDRLIEINGAKIVTRTELQSAMNRIAAGDEVSVKVKRDDQIVEATYKPRVQPFLHNDHYFGISFAQRLIIHGLQSNGPAALAGLKKGEEIVSIDWPNTIIEGSVQHEKQWTKVVSQPMLREALAIAGKSLIPLGLRIKGEDGETRDVEVDPRRIGASDVFAIAVMFKAKELTLPLESKNSLVVADVLKGSAAWEAGLRAGDTIIDVPSVPMKHEVGGIASFGSKTLERSIAKRIAAAAQGVLKEIGEEGSTSLDPVKVRIERDGKQSDLEITPSLDGDNARGLLVLAQRIKRTDPIVYGFGDAIGVGFQQTHKNMTKILLTLKGLFTGAVSPTQLAGPVMIAKASYDLTQYGFGTLLFFLGFISINLAVVNLLPVPVLDGGLLLIVTLEKLKGGPLPEKAMGIVNLVSFVGVIGLMLFVVFNDIRNIFFL